MRNTLLILGVLLLLSVVLWFVFRNQILNYAWNKASTKLEKKGYQLQCKSKSFTGFSSIHFSDIKLD
ncbi:MAG: hypothetical protein IT244_08635, partial [Bacteroidia bacterium]|nr:hypothetical protein [Bacteroidia bacterium]